MLEPCNRCFDQSNIISESARTRVIGRLGSLQVRSVLQLYADIEHTSRNNAFYEKYNLRYSMGELLCEAAAHASCLTSYRVALQARACRAVMLNLPVSQMCQCS